MGLLDQDSRKNLDNAEESMNAMWYHFSLYSNSLRGMLKSGSLLVKELGKMYDESDGLLGDNAIKDLKSLQKVDESSIIPLVDELDAVNASSKAKYDKLLKIFRLRMKRADLLKEEFEKMDENWKKAREKNKKGGEEKLKKKNEMLVEAERTYKEYNLKLIEDVIVFCEQKFDYLDPVIYCMLKVKFSLDSTMDSATKSKLLSDYEKKIESCDDYAIPFENSANKKLSLSKVIYNPWGRKYFRKYLQREHSEENLEFWSEIEIFRQSDPKNKEALLEKAKKIYNKFLNAELNATVNISGKSLGNMREIFTSESKMAKVDRHTFDGCQKEIFELMKSDSYDRFTKNEAYEHLLYRLRPKPSEESLLATLPGVDLSATANSTNSNYSMLGQDVTSPVNIRRVGASASGSSLVSPNAASSPLGTSPLKRTVSWSQNLLKTSNSSLSTSSENLSVSPPNNTSTSSSSSPAGSSSVDDSNPFDYGTASIPNPFENAGPVTPPKPAVEPRHILVRASDGSLSKIAVYPKAMDSTTAPLTTSSSNLKTSVNTPVVGEDTKKAVENSLKNIMEGSSAMKLGKAVESTTTTTTTSTTGTTPNTLEINVNNENNNNSSETPTKQISRPTRPGTDPKTTESSKVRKAKVLFSFQAVDDNELSLSISDIIQIHEWTDPEWWLASKAGKLGYIPSNYVKFVEEEDSWNFKVKALFDYVKRSERELSLKEGDVLEVKDITPKDWWQGKNKAGESGYFPCNHVKLLQ